MRLVTAAEMRELDRLTIEKYGTAGYTLMQRAGRGATDMLLREMPKRGRRHVVVCAGRGNNGGDGFVIARELRRHGVTVEVFLLAAVDEVRGDAARALAAYRRARGRLRSCVTDTDLPALQAALAKATFAVDALFGTGLNGDLRGVGSDVVDLLNRSGVPVFAVDIPSGLDSDRGVPLGRAVRAQATATFGAVKLGQVMPPGTEYVGRLTVVDIGIAPQAWVEVAPRHTLLDAVETAPLVPRRGAAAHKGDCGHVLVIAGSKGKTGAAKLAAIGALRAGAGLVTVAVPRSEQPVVAGALLEAMTEVLGDDDAGRVRFDGGALARLVEGKRAVVFGPGIGTHEDADRVLHWLLDHVEIPLVVDADGLTCAAREVDCIGRARGPVILTPHPGEMSRLAGVSTADVQADRVGTTRGLAMAQRCTVALKGAGTVVADPDGTVGINSSGNPGMASGGMGDVLTGVVGGLLAQGLSAGDATRLGVFAHGRAGDEAAHRRGPIGLVASDLASELPGVFRALLEGASGDDM